MRCKCKVPNCSNEYSLTRRRDGITFHPFPTEKIILNAWLQSLGITSYEPFDDNVICSEHFNERDIFTTKQGFRKIHHNAIPVYLEPEEIVSAKVCRICFVMDDKMKCFKKYHKLFEEVTGILLDDENSKLPQRICWECEARLAAAANFRAKALLSDGMLHDLLSKESDLKYSNLKTIKRAINGYGFESKLKQVTFDIEHFDINIRDTFVDTNNVNKLEHDYVDNDLHEIIDENEVNDENKDNDENKVNDENVDNDEMEFTNNEAYDNDENEFTNNGAYDNDENEFTNNKTDNDETEFTNYEVYDNDENEFTNNKTYDNDETEFTNYEAYDNDETEYTDKEIEDNDEREFITILNEDTDLNGYETSNFDKKIITFIEDQNTERTKVDYETFDTEELDDTEIVIESTEADIPDVNNDFAYENNDSNNDFIYHNEEVHKKVKRERFAINLTGPSLKQLEFENNDSNNEFFYHNDERMKVKRKRLVVNRKNARDILKCESDVCEESYSVKKGGVTVFYAKNLNEIPAILLPLKPYFTITPISQEQEIKTIQERKETDGYLLAPYKCKVCYQGFVYKNRYETHMNKHDKRNGSFQCGICLIFKRNAIDMRSHMNKHTHEMACKQCSFVTRLSQVAKLHIKFHDGNSTATCSLCSRTFERKTSYYNHLRLNHLSDVVCDFCGYTFVSNFGLQQHKKKAHKYILNCPPSFEGPHCDKCDVTFLSENAYEIHLRCSSKHLDSETDPSRIRNDRNSYITRRRDLRSAKCDLCGEVCSTMASYNHHVTNFHPELAPANRKKILQHSFMCEQCGKTFKNKLLMDCHQWTHTGQKLYQCDDCEKSFSQKINLSRHIEHTHMGATVRYDCKICGKTVGTRPNFTRHIKYHISDRKWKCRLCEKKFLFHCELRMHIEFVHNKKPYPKKKNVAEKTGKRRKRASVSEELD